MATAKSTFADASAMKVNLHAPDFKGVRVSVSAEFRELVTNTTISKAFPSHEVFFAKSTDSIAAVFSQLIEKRIMAMPVLDVKKNEYVAWVDILDIMVYVIERLQLGNPHRTVSTELASWVTQNDFTTLSCEALFSKAARNPWLSVNQTDSLQHLIEIMGRWNCHRVAVVDSKNRVTGVVTMSAFSRWLHKQGRGLGNMALMSIRQLNLGFKPVVSVRSNQLALDAFLAIANRPIGGVAVVDSNGFILGNISANDFKEIGWAAQMFAKVYLTCDQFCQLRMYGGYRPLVISVEPDATLNKVLETMSSNKIHRCYITTEDGGDKHLKGVIALGDVFLLFAYALHQKH